MDKPQPSGEAARGEAKLLPHIAKQLNRIIGFSCGHASGPQGETFENIRRIAESTARNVAALEAHAAPAPTGLPTYDEQVNLVKACEHIAEGTEGWQKLRNECPSTAAVAALRDAYESFLPQPTGYEAGFSDALEMIPARQPTGDVGELDSADLVIWAADLTERHLSDRGRWKDYIEDVKLIAARAAGWRESHGGVIVHNSIEAICYSWSEALAISHEAAEQSLRTATSDVMMKCREIVCSAWQQAVKDHDLKPGSKIEAVFGLLLNDLDSYRAALTGAKET
jgi:hypothetical protein